MKSKAWTVNPLLAGLLVLVLGVPCAVAADDDQTQAAAAGEKKAPEMSPEARILPGTPGADSFGPEPEYPQPYDAQAQLDIYGGKHMNPTAFPPIDLGLQLYERGAYEPRPTWLGGKNPIMSAFMAYGDVRVAAADYDNGIPANGKSEHSVVAARLNLDMDWALTATERIHAFARPLDKNGLFTRYEFGNGAQDKFTDEFNFNLKTLFFEGDLGAMAAGLSGRTNHYDVPIAVGRVPIATQNGIWIDDAFDGLAVGLVSAKNSPRHDISNMDLTFFAGFNNVATAAVPGNTNSNVFGLAGFADARKGYVEWGYGYVDAQDGDLSYHNVTAAFSRRYKGRLSNSVRLIGNFGQQGDPGQAKTADGVLVLVENSLTPKYLPWGNQLNFVPYFNVFAGFKSPQSLARAADAGGVLKNTGINFETDGLTGYPTLDATAHDSYGGAFGLEYLFSLDRQIVVEGAVVERRSNSLLGNQYALGARYQHPFTHTTILRLDAMRGWRQGLKDVYGVRVEIRRKI
jgi:hypothetical protein